jgi:hypothetical protein
MKRILFSGVLAASLTAGLQAYAQDPTFTTGTVTLGTGSGGQPVTYNGTVHYSSLVAPGPIAYSSAYNLGMSGTMVVDMYVPGGEYGGPGGTLGSEITVDFGSTTPLPFQTAPTGASSGETSVLTYTLSAADLAYIAANNPISFSVSGDCYVDSYDLTVNASKPTGGAPDGGSTVLFLGGALSVLGLIKRKVA